jgi:hypothetical protein
MPKYNEEEVTELRARVKELEARLLLLDQTISSKEDDKLRLEMDAATLRQELDILEQENANLRASLKSKYYAGSGQMVITPPKHRPAARLDLHRNRGYVLMPFKPAWSNEVYDAIEKAFSRSGRSCQRADRQIGPDIMLDVWRSICHCGVIVADVTTCNPNVMYEVGLADAVGKEMILISQTANPLELAFDLLGLRLIVYESRRLSELTVAVEKRLAEWDKNKGLS